MVFGPVPSRRLGRSMGVDLLPFKTCSLDCLYCQLGCTTNKTIERRAWVEADEVLAQVAAKIEAGARPDYFTLSGSGEPTLHLDIGRIIREIKSRASVPVAVLTNGTMLWDGAVRAALADADLVVPSLDAVDEDSFRKVNHPHPAINFPFYLDGLRKFAEGRSGKMWLEVFILAGINDDDAFVESLRKIVATIPADRVQLNTAIRPPAYREARAASRERLEAIAAMLGSNAEVVASYKDISPDAAMTTTAAEILEMLKRRPCSLSDLSSGLRADRNIVAKCVGMLAERGEVAAEEREGATYYAWRQK